jgi:MASE1
MENAKWRGVAKGLGFSLLYCVAYRAAWFNSLDQWFLPAGIRVAGMLFLPFRYWPYLFLGDAAAVLSIRAPKAEQYGELWAYLSPFLLAPMISLAPLLFRTQLKKIHENVAWLPVVALSIAAWASFCKLALNHMLSGPSASDVPDKFFQYVTGDCLGILILVPSIMVWLRRKSDAFLPRKFILDTLIAVSMIFVMYLAVLSPELNSSLRQIILVMMILPAAGLTVLHGWRGAAIGITATNAAIGFALPEFNTADAHDQNSYVAQQVLVVAASILMMLGSMISKLFDNARKVGISELHALELAQSSFLSTERNLREKFLYMAQMQLGFDDYRKKLVVRLKAHGHHEAAMDLNTEGVEQMEWFDRHAIALYPIQIEKDGLFAALHADAFTRFWAGGAEVMYLVKGHPKGLSLGLQLAAYRCTCNAFALLSEYTPDYYEVRARAWQYGGRRGVSFRVTIKPTVPPESSSAGTLAALELEGRVKAYGGAVRRRHMHQIIFLLSENIGDATHHLHSAKHFPLLHH